MPLYEHVFMARQDVSTAQVEAMLKEYAQVIEEGGGKIAKSEYWGLKSLAYKIKKSRKAHYALMNIDSPPAAVVEMERRMGISTDVIRFLTVRVEEHETEPSAQMRKSDRDDRRGRLARVAQGLLHEGGRVGLQIVELAGDVGLEALGVGLEQDLVQPVALVLVGREVLPHAHQPHLLLGGEAAPEVRRVFGA